LAYSTSIDGLDYGGRVPVKVYGGQAVIEGVMMRGRTHMAVACRAPDGQIVVHSERLTGRIYGSRLLKYPFLRGSLMIWDTLALGMRALMFAANIAATEPPKPAAADGSSGSTTEPVSPPSTEPAASAMPAGVMWGTMAIALVGAVGLFFVLPVLIVGYLDQFIESSVTSNVVEKAIRLAILLGYMWAIGQMSDIRQVFQYHGAEHKTINAHEAGAPLTPEVVARYPIEHPRCGTTFLLIVMVISFFVFSLLGRPALEIRIISRIVLIPFIAGIAYEFIRWAGLRYSSSAAIRTLMAPGLLVQKLTTRDPSLDQIAVAIAALEPVLLAEEPDFRPVRATVPDDVVPAESAVAVVG
jgi:uncharacterized protein YqhQ